MKLDVRATGINAAAASAVFLGLAPIFGKQAILYGFSPLAVVAFRSVVATILLSAIMALFKRSFFYIFPVGLAGCLLAGTINGLGSILYYTALSRLDTSIGQLIYSFYPLFVAVWLMLDRQPMSPITLFRLAFSLIGVYLLISKSQNSVDLIGAGMMLGSAILYALHLIINQRVLYEVPAPTVTLYTLFAMSATVLIAYLAFDRRIPPVGTPWWPLFGMALIVFVSRLTLFMGVKHLGGLQTAMLGLGELLVTVILAHIFLGDQFNSMQLVGAGLLVVSLILVGFDRVTPEKRNKTGLFAWLNPPQIRPGDINWPTNP